MYSTIKKWARENREAAIILCLAAVAFFVYSHFYFSIADEAASSLLSLKFNSPDETANYFFAKNYAENGVLRIFEPLNFIAENRIAPRSVAVVGGYLVPGSFLGLILIYGWLAKILGLKMILFFTPLLSCFAVFCFYEIIKKIFNRQIAFWSALLLLIHPAFWYYASRGLFPNALFVSFLIFSFYFLMRAAEAKKTGEVKILNYIDFILAGLFLGLAMTVRLSEIIWVGGVFFILFLSFRKNVKWSQVAVFLLFAILTFSPIFTYNQIFYGNYLVTAYNLNNNIVTDNGGAGVNWLASLGCYILPFGLHLKNILKNLSNYFVGMFWWLSVPLAVGALWQVKKFISGELDKKQKIYLIIFGFAALLLFCYYGSWLFYDNPAEEVSIGTSYARYWLPVYILSLPFSALVFSKLISRLEKKWNKIAALVLAAICLFLSVNLVFYDRNDGLAVVRKNVFEYARIEGEVGKLVESDAIIIVDHADKIFFPEHKVIQPLRNDGTYKLIPRLASEMPLYYYGVTLPDKDIDYLYKKKLNPQEVKIEKIRDFGAESLYKFIPAD